MWKPLPCRRVLKSWGWQRYVTGQSGQYLVAVDLGCYKWYQSQSARTLGSQGGGLWDSTSVGEGNETLLIRVWQPLPCRHVLNPWDRWRYVMGQSGQCPLIVGLDYYVTGQNGQYLLAVGLCWNISRLALSLLIMKHKVLTNGLLFGGLCSGKLWKLSSRNFRSSGWRRSRRIAVNARFASKSSM